MKGGSMFLTVLKLVHLILLVPWLVWFLVAGFGRHDSMVYRDPLFWLLGSSAGTLNVVVRYLENGKVDYIGVGFTAFYIVMLWITRKNWRNRGRRKGLKRFGYKAKAARDKMLKNLRKVKLPVGLRPIPQPV